MLRFKFAGKDVEVYSYAFAFGEGDENDLICLCVRVVRAWDAFGDDVVVLACRVYEV